MTEAFVASNGVHVHPNKTVNGETSVESFDAGHCLGGEVMQALREFFLHEAGIWVDPETGAHVYRRAYSDDRDGRCVLVVTPDESIRVWEKLSAEGDGASAIVARYFTAHHEPKPWQDAKAGEVWVVTIQTGPTVDETACTVVELDDVLVFEDPVDGVYISVTDEILDARRIWPEVVSDAA